MHHPGAFQQAFHPSQILRDDTPEAEHRLVHSPIRVRGSISHVRLVRAQQVDTEDSDAGLHDPLCGIAREEWVIKVGRGAPVARPASVYDHDDAGSHPSLVGLERLPGNTRLWFKFSGLGDIDDQGGPNEERERQFVDIGTAGNEMRRGIDVGSCPDPSDRSSIERRPEQLRAGVRAHGDRVNAISVLRDGASLLAAERRVSGIYLH
jgi:hypothetical protein